MALIPRFSKPSDATADREWRSFELDVKNGLFKTDELAAMVNPHQVALLKIVEFN
jgi:hypothetical protein